MTFRITVYVQLIFELKHFVSFQTFIPKRENKRTKHTFKNHLKKWVCFYYVVCFHKIEF